MPDFFEQDEFYRRKERVKLAEERNAKLALLEAEAARQRKIRADRLTERANESFLRHAYACAGVAPPFVDLDSNPTVSLELLLQVGWQIQALGGGKSALLRPYTAWPAAPDHSDRPDQNTCTMTPAD